MAGTELTDGEIYTALEATKGNIGAAAKSLGERRARIAARIMKNPELASLIQDFRESLVDTAEDNIRTDVEVNRDPTSSRFVAQTLGKERGWAVGVGGQGKGGAVVVELRSFEQGAEDAERE